MERAVGKNEKLESLKLKSLKLESCAELGKNPAKLERTERSWKVLDAYLKVKFYANAYTYDIKLNFSFMGCQNNW